jgi:hypothetical protein
MKLSSDQLSQLDSDGYVIIDCPFPRSLTDACLDTVSRVAVDPVSLSNEAKKNHFSLAPQIPDSSWCTLDHSLPFLQIELHPEIIEIARQLVGTDDIYFRNGGINELAPERGFLWHRNSEWDYIEFMHYFSNASVEHGCLRVIPGSHEGEKEQWMDEVAKRRKTQGYPDSPTMEGPADVEMDYERRLEVSSNQIIVRSSKILHTTWKNQTPTGRLVHHWLFHRGDEPNHRFTWRDYLKPDLIDSLSGEQREVLWLDCSFEIDDKYLGERERELGKISWGVM